MLIYLARRLALALVTCAAISVLTFVIIRLPPGDFVDAYIANLAVGGSSVSAEQAAAMRREYGLDRPVVVQYGLWMGKVLRGDFGVSMMWRRPVTEVIGGRAIFCWRLCRDHARLHRTCDPQFPARFDPDVSRVPLSRPERRRIVHAGIRASPLELGKVLGSDGAPAVAGVGAGAGRHRAIDSYHARQSAR